MLRMIVEEAAALASLALFLLMIAIWTQVIAAPKPTAAPTVQANGAFKGGRLQGIMGSAAKPLSRREGWNAAG